MQLYTFLDWFFTIGSALMAILLGFYVSGAACLLGLLFYLIYPFIIEYSYNSLSEQQEIIIRNMPEIPIVYHENYNITACGIEKWHPFDSCKYGNVYRQIRQKVKAQHFTPSMLSRGTLLYLGMSRWYLLKMCYSAYVSTLIELPVFFLPGAFLRSSLLDPMLLATSGSIYAAKLAIEKGWAINLSGGYHHASLNGGGGFCIYPDITLVVNYLKKCQNLNKIVIVDLDAHQGNGYERDFLQDSSVYIIDFYNSYIYPGDHEAEQAINCFEHVDKNTTDEQYIMTLQRNLEKHLKDDMEFIIYNAGSDIMGGDPLGNCCISPAGLQRRDEVVFKWANHKKIPILMLLSGGYQKENTYAIGESILQLIP
ncbi:unnamed protein product (macronuclear) [Paramecium tetraurelia]|uniref:Histone deacetylase domain-containing protein n=1 Tax=Paramecium tetraurelia TaxID=5888 RepID=A0CQZ7_PARTE|nr:uncharacterized protein GSPATT00038870001 [Paramecium tetraurelia]CAK73214.1 unnamed protein product [Paramecium tetraurelia]|eukprot:XP_001440611.1 hypothetical protein (macronuclear) [Paramecium tetraurelia strain d4-2]